MQTATTPHTSNLCPTCGARKVPGASACWQCGGAFAPQPAVQASPQRWLKIPWVGVIPFGLFFLPWAVAGPYWAHRVVSIAGLELALGRTLRGRAVLHEPLLWLVPLLSILLAVLLSQVRRLAPESRHWLLTATVAWIGFLLLVFKAVQWLWFDSSPGTGWVVRWLTSEYVVSVLAFLVSALSATRTWMDRRGFRPQSSSASSSS